MDIYNQLKIELNAYDAECRMVSVNHIPELESVYCNLFEKSLLDKQLYDKYISYIDFLTKEKYPTALSLIIVATPSYRADLKFQFKNKNFSLKIPPIYSDKETVTDRIKKLTSEIFNKNGYNTFPVVLPKKLIAVKSGLAKYGKNNLAYINGMGSYHRLTLFATDLPCDYDTWQTETQTLDRCKKCLACQKICPTSAISKNKFLINAERCLSYFNEQPAQFPAWIDSSSHNCIVGCLKCQEICPENKNYASTFTTKETFDERETQMILANVPYEKLPEDLQTRISNLCLKYYYNKLSRNISPLIENQIN